MKCSWCDEKADHVIVFGSMVTMEVWDIVSCWHHASVVKNGEQFSGEPIWAPTNSREDHNQAHYADAWEIREMKMEP
jgi:hypothetical protein